MGSLYESSGMNALDIIGKVHSVSNYFLILVLNPCCGLLFLESSQRDDSKKSSHNMCLGFEIPVISVDKK